MSTSKEEMMDKLQKVNAELCGLKVLMHRVEEFPDVHFEIGRENADGTTQLCLSTRSIKVALEHFAMAEMTEQRGFLIDVWEDGKQVADVGFLGKREKSRVIFEINEKKMIDLEAGADNAGAVPMYEYETVFRSASAIDCCNEWKRKRYSDRDYVIDIREAPEGKESYHVADIKISTIVKEEPKENDRAMLVELIRQYTRGDKMLGASAELADRILHSFGRGKS